MGPKNTHPKDSKVTLRTGPDSGTNYRDNKDGTIHVSHFAGDVRQSYDVPYGKDADNVSNATSGTEHTVKNK